MSTAYKSLVLAIACVATILLLLLASAPPEAPRSEAGTDPSSTAGPETTTSPGPGARTATTRSPTTRSPTTQAPTTQVPVTPDNAGKFYFDVVGHSAEEFHALLERARMIYEATAEDDRQTLKVVLVLHGPDIEFFAAKNYGEYRDIVDLAAKLDAFDVFDFRMCAASAASRGLDESDVPAFIEFVPYGPTEIRRLEDAGFVQL